MILNAPVFFCASMTLNDPPNGHSGKKILAAFRGIVSFRVNIIKYR